MPWRGDPVSRQLPRLAPGDATPGLHRNGTAGSGAGVVRREVCRGHPPPKSNCAFAYAAGCGPESFHFTPIEARAVIAGLDAGIIAPDAGVPLPGVAGPVTRC